MKVIAYTQNGSIFFDEVHNDHEMIVAIIEKSVEKENLDKMFHSMGPDENGVPLDAGAIDERWNEYMLATIRVLEAAGCEILWDN
jgi:hypothetical protein